jgi:hypothetical protein
LYRLDFEALDSVRPRATATTRVAQWEKFNDRSGESGLQPVASMAPPRGAILRMAHPSIEGQYFDTAGSGGCADCMELPLRGDSATGVVS